MRMRMENAILTVYTGAYFVLNSRRYRSKPQTTLLTKPGDPSLRLTHLPFTSTSVTFYLQPPTSNRNNLTPHYNLHSLCKQKDCLASLHIVLPPITSMGGIIYT